MTEHLSQTDISTLTAAAEMIVALDIQIAELAEQRAQLASVFKNPDTGLVPNKEPYVFGKVKVKVSANGRLDDTLARDRLPAATYRHVSKQTLDTARARKYLPQEDLADITKTYDNKIEFRI